MNLNFIFFCVVRRTKVRLNRSISEKNQNVMKQTIIKYFIHAICLSRRKTIEELINIDIVLPPQVPWGGGWEQKLFFGEMQTSKGIFYTK